MIIETLKSKILQQQLNLIINKTKRDYDRVLERHREMDILHQKASELNNTDIIKYCNQEIEILDELIKCFYSINNTTKDLLKNVLLKTSKYLYQNQSDDVKSLEEEAYRAFKSGDNITLEEISNKVNLMNLSFLERSEDQYKMILLVLDDVNDRLN